MIEAMHEAQGIGLAAQQVGHPIQLCVVDLRVAEVDFEWTLDGAKPPLELFMPMVIANPKVSAAKKAPTATADEGCLSFPEIRGDVSRVREISVKFQDQAGLRHTLDCTGLFARCILHEVDHLNGVLFIDRMEKEVREAIEDAVKALAKETRAGRTAAT